VRRRSPYTATRLDALESPLRLGPPGGYAGLDISPHRRKGSAEVRVTLGAIDPHPDDAGSAMLRDMLRDGAMQFWVIRSYAVNENLSDLNPGCNQI
jgi:hypothetical protein